MPNLKQWLLYGGMGLTALACGLALKYCGSSEKGVSNTRLEPEKLDYGDFEGPVFLKDGNGNFYYPEGKDGKLDNLRRLDAKQVPAILDLESKTLTVDTKSLQAVNGASK